MMIDRRTFVAGTALVAVAPTLGLLPTQAGPSVAAPSAATAARIVFMIEGWSVQDERTTADQVWIRIGRSWRTAWR